MKEKDWYLKMIKWRETHIKESTFILMLAFVVGLLTSITALLLKSLIHLLHQMVEAFVSAGHSPLSIGCR